MRGEKGAAAKKVRVDSANAMKQVREYTRGGANRATARTEPPSVETLGLGRSKHFNPDNDGMKDVTCHGTLPSVKLPSLFVSILVDA